MAERKIGLTDLLIEMLIHWRVAVAVMLIGSIFMGGVSYARSYRSLQTQKEAAENAAEEVLKQEEEKLKETQIANINMVVAYEQIYREKSAYMEESVLMQMDAGDAPRSELTFLIKSDDLERTYNIEKVYEDDIVSGGMRNWVSEQLGNISSVALSELVSLERTSYGSEMGQDTVRLYVMHSDEKECKAIAQSIVEYVASRQEELQETLGEHEIVLVSQSFSRIADSYVLDRQRSTVSDLLSLESTIANAKVNFTDDEEQYYNSMVNGGKAQENGDKNTAGAQSGGKQEEEAENTVAGSNAVPAISTKSVVVGAALAVFLYALIIFLMYLFNNKVRYTDDLKLLFGIPELGKIPADSGRKKVFQFIDRWILKLRNGKRRMFSTQEAIDLAAVDLKMISRKNGVHTVCCIGCDLTQQALFVCEQIQELLKPEGITVKILNNVLYNAETMDDLEAAEGAILVEKAKSTFYEEISREAELLQRQNIKVLGGIIVE